MRDLQFGGDDDFNNIWPLDSSANRSAGTRQNSQIVSYFDRRSGQIRAINAGNRQLTGYYFIIEDVRLEN